MGLFVFEILLFTTVGILHIFGIFILSKYPETMAVNQKNYLMSLSVSEVLLSINHIIMRVTENYFPLELKSNWFRFISLYHFDCLWIANIYILFFLTLDRFCLVFYNLKYNGMFTKKRILMIITGIWGFSGVLSVIFMSLYFGTHFDYLKFTFTYIYPFNDTLLVV